MADPQKALQALTEQYQALQTELSQTLIPARQKLDSQHSENTSVQREFNSLSPIASSSNPSINQPTIYKLVGPVLFKQSSVEAKSAVDGRIGYIEKEIERIEKQIQDVQGKMEGMRGEIYGLQSQVQGQQEKA